MVNPGTPLGKSTIVTVDGVSESDAAKRLTGFSMVTAENIDAAIAMAKACPFLEMGSLEVAEVMQM